MMHPKNIFIGIDVGNSATKCAVIDADYSVVKKYSIPNDAPWSVSDVMHTLSDMLLDVSECTIGISSVVPEKTALIQKHLLLERRIAPTLVDVHRVHWMKFAYEKLDSLGADRICTAIAAREAAPLPLVVIDFGTATTFNVIDQEGNFVGGAIAPGLDTMRVGLMQRTAQLPDVRLQYPASVIASSTESSMQSGLLYLHQFGWEGMLQRIEEELQSEVSCIVTGGLAGVATEKTKRLILHDQNLLLKGMRMFTERVTA